MAVTQSTRTAVRNLLQIDLLLAAMRIVKRHDLVEAGRFPASGVWARAAADVEAAISSVVWPPGSATFKLNPQPSVLSNGKRDRHPNGVVPIKLPLIRHLSDLGWEVESLPPLPVGELLTTGDLDALLLDDGVYVAFEWETGNVSSSHRAISKMLDALCRGTVAGGMLVLPVRETQRFMTDRVGNFEELEPYFRFWSRYPVENGALRIYGVGAHQFDSSVPYIPKGTDGRAYDWRNAP